MTSSSNKQEHQVPASYDDIDKEPDIKSPNPKPMGPNEKGVEHPADIVLDPFFNFELVVFKVENTLFRVPKLAFLNSSEPENPFLKIFSLPPADSSNVEGASLDNPIVLEKESATDFRAFLHALYPLFTQKKTFEELTGVLRLAKKWNFDKIRRKTIAELEWTMHGQGPALNIHMGNEFQVSHWLISGLAELIMVDGLDINQLRSEPLHLDWETIAKIYYIQDLMANQVLVDAPCLNFHPPVSGACRCRAKDHVNVIFRNEIAAAEHPDDAANVWGDDW